MPTFNEDVVVNGKIRIEATGDGAVLVDLSSDRSWALRQRSSGESTALELASVGGGGNKNLLITTTGRVNVSGGVLQLTNRGDGKVLLHLDSERGWVFKQRGTDGATALELTAANPGNNNKDFLITTDGQVGISTGAPTHKLHVGGNVRIASDLLVEGSIRVVEDVTLDGADCAEEFEVDVEPGDGSEPDDDSAPSPDPGPCPGPGTVMVVGRARRLRPCSQPYDTRVAGIVSGAGDLRPGIVLGRRPQQAGTHRIPVALNGTVHCRVDATVGPIGVGDLLTTSARTGCAMRASDPTRSFGAILGKALDDLPAGVGSIPVLVTLH